MAVKSKSRRLTKAELELLGIVRCFQKYTHLERADMAASHRLGYRQRQANGRYYYITTHRPDVGFDTQGQAVAAARKVLFGSDI